ncbi:MAG: hypothetical protein QOE72_3666, partial [Chloroflexota bacterium]|nr:hypothetical protein [Chloroflexota bacterium]
AAPREVSPPVAAPPTPPTAGDLPDPPAGRPAEARPQPPAAAPEPPLPPPAAILQRSVDPESSEPPPDVTGFRASQLGPLQPTVTAAGSPPPLVEAAAERSGRAPVPPPAAGHAVVSLVPATGTRAVVIPAHRPTVAQARLEVAAPLVQPRLAATEALSHAFRDGPTAAAPVSPAVPRPLVGTPGRLAPSAGGATPGQPLSRAAVVQRDATFRPPSAPALDLPPPLRAAATSGEPRTERVATPASQRATIADIAPQRAVEPPPAAPAPPLASAQQQATAKPPVQGAAGTGGARPEGEMEELARRLYEHIGTRLRAELLVERERAGMVTDLR